MRLGDGAVAALVFQLTGKIWYNITLMSERTIERLAKAIGYPDKIPDGVVSFAFRVDGTEIVADEKSGRLVLSCSLSDNESERPTLAAWAAGRMLREDAVLAYGDGTVFLWQDAQADADARALLRLFETFADSCDWWRARIAGLRGEGTSSIESTVIRP